ncbi:MAG: plasmid pRiA4b ORF-3 family protein [Acidimicrobiia bacterium]|nr:plasmid pRiA4b ORF-3 family protein [Acidimicrobiia bacterium]
MFQAAMGWEDCHLPAAFDIGEGAPPCGMQFDEYPDGELQEKDFTVVTAIGNTERFTYEYDFGDSWVHEITVHRVWRMAKGLKFAVCLESTNGVPEDIQMVSLGQLLEVLADPTHEDYEHLSEWVGRPVDPEEFDLAFVNARLQAVR